jgi:hypothetical protein
MCRGCEWPVSSDFRALAESPQVADYCLSAIDGTRLRIQPVDATH